MVGMAASGVNRLLHDHKKSLVPPFTYVNLTYPIAFTSSSTTGGDWYWQFRLNSLYDPDATGTGSQPTGFDQWMALYERYRVIACEVDLVVGNTAFQFLQSAMAGSNAVPTLDYFGVAGMRDACIGKMSTYPSMNRIKKTWFIKDVLGCDEESLYAELNNSGTAGSNAPSVAYGTIGVRTQGATDAVWLSGVMRFAVRLEIPIANNVSLSRSPTEKPLVAVSALTREELESRVREYLASKAATATSAVAPVPLLRH